MTEITDGAWVELAGLYTVASDVTYLEVYLEGDDAKTEFHLGLCVACFGLHLHFVNRFSIGLGLLRDQLNDSDTRRPQKREYQSTRFHIGNLIGFQHAC